MCRSVIPQREAGKRVPWRIVVLAAVAVRSVVWGIVMASWSFL